MVVIFGWGAGKAQDLGEVAPTTCPNCHNQVFLHHIQSDKQVSLYFIPIMPYGSNEYLACPICRYGLQIGPSQRQAVVKMKGATRRTAGESSPSRGINHRSTSSGESSGSTRPASRSSIRRPRRLRPDRGAAGETSSADRRRPVRPSRRCRIGWRRWRTCTTRGS